MVNRVGLPWKTLPTFLSFPHFHTFRNGGPRMIWDSHSSSMEEPNVDEKEHAMGSTLAPQLCMAFFKEPVSRFWGKLWISTTSHGFSAWSWQNNYVLANHTHPFHPIFHLLHLLLGQLWWCKGGWSYNRINTPLAIMVSRMPRDIYGCGIGN